MGEKFTQMVEQARSVWKALALIGTLLVTAFGAGAAASPLTARTDPALVERVERVESVNARQDARMDTFAVRFKESDQVDRFTACVLRAQSRAQDATPCESHLSASVLDYLRPRSE